MMEDSRPAKRPRKAPHAQNSEERGTSNPADEAEGNGKKSAGKKPPLSCAECRRLKLKCDRVFPCKSCTKRGCAEICPDGALTSGKGSRFILANTEQLHAKIIQMSDRIRHLEEALETLQSSCSTESHPLLRQDLLLIKNTVQLYGETGSLQAGSSSVAGPDDKHEDDDAQPILEPPVQQQSPASGSKRQPEVRDDPYYPKHTEVFSPDDGPLPDLPADIIKLSRGFPIPLAIAPRPDYSMRQRLREHLPSREVAQYLYEQARQNAFWQYNPHPNETFYPNLLRHIYTSPIDTLSAERLGLLFMILAVGSLVDLKQAPDSPDGEKYHHLARAALCERPVMEDTSVDTVIAMFYMTWYLVVFSDKKKGIAHAWGMMGLTSKLAQSIGLHRDGCGSKMIPEEVDTRRALFWELLHLDARLALSLGRPASLFLQHSDCKRPSYTPEAGYDPSESLHHYQEWKHSSYVYYLSPVLELVSSPAPDYPTVIEVDSKVRNAYIPPMLQSSGGCSSRYLAMQQATLSSAIEAVFLQLHRTFFTRALSGPEPLTRRHRYAPSVVAVFRSSVRLITIIETLQQQEPNMTLRFLSFYANAFSAAVALCLLVSRAPFACLSPMALQELERALRLFKHARERSPRAFQVIPILETMVDKSRSVYTKWVSGGHQSSVTLWQSVDDSSRRTGIDPCMAGDAFSSAHPHIIETMQEAHQRAAHVRHPCTDGFSAVEIGAPVPPPLWLPQEQPTPSTSDGYSANYAYQVSPDGSSVIPLLSTSTVNASFRVPIVDTLNFDFGALNTNWKDESWMAWF